MRYAPRQAAVLLQNMVFWPLFFAVSLIYIPLASALVLIVSIVLPRRRTMKLLRRTISRYGQIVLCCSRPFAKVLYKDMAPVDGDGPFVFICNHRSSSDPFLMACLPYECVQIAKKWPLRLPILGTVARLAGYLSIHEMPLESFFERAGHLYRSNVCLISFPEGTRSGNREMGQFTSAIFRLVKRLRATIVPVAITGNENMPPRGSLILHPGVVCVHKLPALAWDEYKDMPIFTLKNHVRALIQKHIDMVED